MPTKNLTLSEAQDAALAHAFRNVRNACDDFTELMRTASGQDLEEVHNCTLDCLNMIVRANGTYYDRKLTLEKSK
jgi:hypothetical protein